MFESFTNALSGIWGTSQGAQVAQNKAVTNGMTSGGAEALLKGSLPTDPVDKLKLANAYGSKGNTIGGLPSTQGVTKDAWRNMPSINDPDWIKPKLAGRIERVDHVFPEAHIPGVPRMPQRSASHSSNAGGGLFSSAKTLLGKFF